MFIRLLNSAYICKMGTTSRGHHCFKWDDKMAFS